MVFVGKRHFHIRNATTMIDLLYLDEGAVLNLQGYLDDVRMDSGKIYIELLDGHIQPVTITDIDARITVFIRLSIILLETDKHKRAVQVTVTRSDDGLTTTTDKIVKYDFETHSVRNTEEG